jgi:heme/copper-type cytochrome/quinol oxidase subunit 1
MDLQPLISTFAIVGAIGQLFFLFNFFYSVFYGQKSVQNPWLSNTLEWTTPVKHVHGNWDGPLPEVHRWAYDYSNPAHERRLRPSNNTSAWRVKKCTDHFDHTLKKTPKRKALGSFLFVRINLHDNGRF